MKIFYLFFMGGKFNISLSIYVFCKVNLDIYSFSTMEFYLRADIYFCTRKVYDVYLRLPRNRPGECKRHFCPVLQR